MLIGRAAQNGIVMFSRTNKNVYLGADIAKYDYGSGSGIDSLNRSAGFTAKQESCLISISYKF